MKGKKNILKTLGLTLLSACLLSGSVLLAGTGQSINEKKIKANAYETISNSVPSFFKKTNIENDNAFVSYLSSEYAGLSFDLEENEIIAENGKFMGTYKTDTNYLAFDINNITTSINGKTITGVDINYSGAIKQYYERYKKNESTTYDGTKTYYTYDYSTGEYTAVSSDVASIADANTLLSYYIEIDEASKQAPYGLNFFPENLDLNISVNLNATENKMTDNKLVLKEQGLVEVTVSYTQYELSTKLIDSNVTLETDNILSNQTITYQFFLLDRNSYLEIGTDDCPNVGFDNNVLIRTSSGTPTYKYNYFYSYASNDVAKIKYDAKNYEVTIIKVGANNTSERRTIKYNFDENKTEIYNENDEKVNDTSFGISTLGTEISLNFYNLGEYAIQYSPIAISKNKVYSLAKIIQSQRLYVFGYQALYTIKSGTYGELKKYDETHSSYSSPADLTYLFADEEYKIEEKTLKTLLDEKKYDTIFDNVNIATTDQTPIKFETLTGVNANVPKSKVYYNNGIDENWTETDFSVLSYHSLPGRYIVHLNYTYASFTNESGAVNLSKDFDQFFTFEITKKTPTVDVFNMKNADNFFSKVTVTITNPKDEGLFEYTGNGYVLTTDTEPQTEKTYYKRTPNLYELTENGYVLTTDATPIASKNYFLKTKISDNGYTNDTINIYFDNYDNIYNKNVTLELVRYDFKTKIQNAPEIINWSTNGNLYEILTGGTLTINKDGNYTINIYQQGSSNPIVRRFNIDTDTNFELDAYSVEKSSSTFNNYAQAPVDIITNQSIVFSWKNVKDSGAKTKGYYKYYPISQKALYDESFIKEHLEYYVRKNVVPIDYELDLSINAEWTPYTNFNYSANASSVVSSQYIKSNAGLYIFQTYDDAGNTQTKAVILDTTEPLFLLYDGKSTTVINYEVLTQNNTVTEDKRVIWGKYKVIKIPAIANGDNAGKYSLELQDSSLYVDRFGNYDTQVYTAINALVCGRELASPHAKANMSFLSLPNRNSTHSSYYLCVEIEDSVYFKNYNVGDTGYTSVSGESLGYKYDIVSSYNLYMFKDTGKVYRSTTESENLFITVENRSGQTATNYSASNLVDVDIYLYNGSNYIIAFERDGAKQYYSFDSVNNVITAMISVGISDGKLTYNGTTLTKVDFVDKEGTYTFLIRDKANTQGLNIAERNRYLSFPSAYEYIKVTADQSQLRAYFIDSDNKEIELADSSYFNNQPIIENEGTEDETTITQKTSYFSPTNENVVYVSFLPTITSGDTKIQVKEVTLDYYEFETKRYDYIVDVGKTSNASQANFTIFNYYKSLKKVWSNPITIYSYAEDGEYEDIDTDGVRKPFVYELNVNENKTKAGVYVITRTYMTNENKGDNSNNYIVTSYDYEERTLNAYVDRYDTITQSETIAPNMEGVTIQYTYTEKPGTNEEKKYEYFAPIYAIADNTINNVTTDKKYTRLYFPITDDNKFIAIDKSGKAINGLDGTAQNIANYVTLQLKTSANAESNILLSKLDLGSKVLTSKSGQKYFVLDLSQPINGTTYERVSSISVTTFTTDFTYAGSSTQGASLSATSTQSLVGNSILTTMYATYSKNSVVSIAHPGQTETEMMIFNSSDSFYTRENTNNITDLTSLFSTNKLPLAISIPKYKYTTYFTKTIKDAETEGKSVISNYVYETDILSYYDTNDKEGSGISSYELEVEVDFYQDQIEDNAKPTKVYKSNGTVAENRFKNGGMIQSEKSGYLALFDYNTQTGEFGAQKKEFTDAGYYVVRITQAANEVEASSYNFKSTYSFCFTIEKNQPEFNLYAGTLLKSIKDTKFYENSSSLQNQERYYTNKTEVSAIWTDSSSPYTANIDKKNIYVNLNGVGVNNLVYQLSIDLPEDGDTNGIVTCRQYIGEGWITIPEASNIFKFTYNKSTLTNTLVFNLKDLGLTSYGSQATITMQLDGHDSAYYQTTSKTIVYDNRASNEIVSALVSYIQSNEYGLNETDVREYYDVDGVTKTDVNNASFNQTISSGVYSQFAFVVSPDFFEQLKLFVKSKIDAFAYDETTSLYIKRIADYQNYIPTSNTYDFVESEYAEITEKTEFEDYELGYYEIVEKDLAGNITVYVINVCKENQDNGEEPNGLSYTANETIDILTDSLISTNRYNVNKGTDLKVNRLNYLGDEWNYFYTSIYNTQLGEYLNSYYLITPELESGYAYKITGVATKTYTKVPLANIFESGNSTYKNYIYVLNKLTGTYSKVSFSLSNIASLTLITGEAGTDASKYAYLSIPVSGSVLANGTLVQAIPVYVEITDKSQDANVVIFGGGEGGANEVNNDPNNELYIYDESYSYTNKWISMSDSRVNVTYSGELLTFTIPNVTNDTKLNFKVRDNFGNTKNEIYLVGETKVTEITSNGNLYTYYGNYNNLTKETSISSTDINVNYHTAKYSVEITPLNITTTGSGLTEIELNKVLDINSLNEINKNTLPFYVTKSSSGSIQTLTFRSSQNQYDILLKVDFVDIEAQDDEAVKTYYIRLYNVLPLHADDKTTNNDYYITLTNSNGGDDTNDLLRKKAENEEEEFLTLNGKTYSVYSSTQTFSDELKVAYTSSASLDFPYEVLYYSTRENWENGQDFVPLDSGYVLDQNGIYYILVKYTSTTVLTNEYYLFKIEILGSSGTSYYILSNGAVKSKAGNHYSYNGTEYSDYYIVNISYQDRAIKEKFEIVTNDYQNILCYEMPEPVFEGAGIFTYRYIVTNYLNNDGSVPRNSAEAEIAYKAPDKVGISPCKIEVFVTFLNPSSDILSITNGTTSNLYYRTNDTADMYVTNSTSQVEMFVYDETQNTDSMTISWFKYYGIKANLINIKAQKDGRNVTLTPKENGNYFYVSLTRSGSYSFRFEDIAGNVQSFYSGQKNLPVIFIKDAHFTMSYTDIISGEEVETEAINKAVYNNEVKLKLNKLLIPYYLASKFGDGNIIHATKNGIEYKDFTYSNEDNSFLFTEAGFYRVSMEAYGKSTGLKIRTQEYTFTIINAKESRYAYEFSSYKDYYIQSIIKDGVDITGKLVKSLGNSSNTTTIKNQTYLKNLILSYYDEKTGAGRYIITICTNDDLYITENHGMSIFTFELYINSRQVPIIVSVEDGASTDKDVTVTFNAKNVYDAVGECYVIVGRDTFYVNETTLDNVTLILGDNEAVGTHFIQVYSMSGNLLFSHKVELKEPMNAWTIIAIIAGVITIVLVTFIVVKLRKRMGVK